MALAYCWIFYIQPKVGSAPEFYKQKRQWVDFLVVTRKDFYNRWVKEDVHRALFASFEDDSAYDRLVASGFKLASPTPIFPRLEAPGEA